MRVYERVCVAGRLATELLVFRGSCENVFFRLCWRLEHFLSFLAPLNSTRVIAIVQTHMGNFANRYQDLLLDFDLHLPTYAQFPVINFISAKKRWKTSK